MYTSRVIQVCTKIQDDVSGHLVCRISGFWAYPCCSCGSDATNQILWKSALTFKIYWHFCFPLKCMGKGLSAIFGVKIFWEIFLTSQRHLLGPNQFFWRSERQNRFSGLGCTLTHETKKKHKNKKTNAIDVIGAYPTCWVSAGEKPAARFLWNLAHINLAAT